MQQLARGQKGKIADIGAGDLIEVVVNPVPRGSQVVDVSCFGLDSDGRLSNDKYFVFYNQKTSPENAIEIVSHYDVVAGESARAIMDLAVHDALAVGNGILTVENSEQAWVRARVDQGDKGGQAARAALAMVAVRKRFEL